MDNLIYIIFALLGLSFLIFIHELGHFWMARRVGMRVETFAIGFGKPLFSWMCNGVKWQIGWLPFGGYVKIAGTETDNDVSPYDVPDGFFGKKPLDRIKVAFMGPFVNLLFAVFVFALLWMSGGREKNFSDFTSKVGWVDTNSKAFALGLRPGDEISKYNEVPFNGYKDHFFAPLLNPKDLKIDGFKIDPKSGKKTPFEYMVEPYSNPHAFDKNILTSGILDSASYIIYNHFSGGKENPLPVGSPLNDSGIQYGDRLLWIDGELIFSDAQHRNHLNDGRILLTIKRGEETLLRRVPRIFVRELRPETEFREELIDWQHEANITNLKFQDLYTIPYNLTYNCVVENVLRFIDAGDQKKAFPEFLYSDLEEALKPGDKIIAVQGTPVTLSYQILRDIQEKKVNIIVQRDPETIKPLSWKDADDNFSQNVNWNQLEKIAKSIGTDKRISEAGNLVLLAPIKPVIRSKFPMSEEAKKYLETERQKKLKEIEQIEEPEMRAHLLQRINIHGNQLVLGLPEPQDRKVVYNPRPTELFSNVFNEIWLTLNALFSGALSPKYVSGPVGIIHVVQTTSMVSIKEAFFWIGAISINLGFLNLLPIPILDGGTILFSLWEMITGKRLKPKTMERVIIIFAIFLISFFLFLTYNDVLRVFGGFLKWK